jgi:hypothetical protein
MPTEALSPAQRFAAIYLPLVLLVGGLTAYLGLQLSQARQDRVESRDAVQLQASARLMSSELERSLQQLQGLEREPALLRAFAESPAQAHLLVHALLESLLYRNAPYVQARWLGPDGIERVRVNRDASALPVAHDVQDRSDRPYFSAAIGLTPGQFYLSALDLNVEHGETGVAHRPMIRAAIRLPTLRGADQGLLVINLAFQHLLDDFDLASLSTLAGRCMLLDSRGNWLLAPDLQDAWGHLFERQDTLARRRPQLWRQIAAADRGGALGTAARRQRSVALGQRRAGQALARPGAGRRKLEAGQPPGS